MHTHPERMSPSNETIAKDLRDVVLHEVCHAFALMSRCPTVVLSLKRNSADKLEGREKTWIGRTTAVGVRDADPYKDAIHGWAGLVGDAMVVDGATAVDMAWNVYEKERETISANDLSHIEMLPQDKRRKAAEDAFHILTKRWDEIKDIQARVANFVERNVDGYNQVDVAWVKDGSWNAKGSNGPVTI